MTGTKNVLDSDTAFQVVMAMDDAQHVLRSVVATTALLGGNSLKVEILIDRLDEAKKLVAKARLDK